MKGGAQDVAAKALAFECASSRHYVLGGIMVTDSMNAQAPQSESIPIATQWLMDAAGPSDPGEINSVFKISCPRTQMLGTGFGLDTGYLISNAHVVQGCVAGDLVVVSSIGMVIPVSSVIVDPDRDLAVMKASLPAKTGLKIHKDPKLKIGQQLSTWGYPFGHPGPAPLWTFGYLSGFTTSPTATPKTQPVKHLVLTGAFNPGNSGGPVLADGAVVGVVVSKRLFSLPPFQASALQALASNPSGVTFTATDDKGKQITFVESQLVADLLNYYRQVSQVFIGEAIAVEELIAFLNGHQIPWNSVQSVSNKAK